jgi:HK97 family phage major capsid protein
MTTATASRTARAPEAPYINLGAIDPRSTFDKWLRFGVDGLNRDERTFYNTMSTTTNSQGGYTVPGPVYAEVATALKDASAIRRVATVIPRESGAPMGFPMSDGTSESGELIGQNTTATAADPSFTTALIAPYKWSSKIITAPIELAQDAGADFMGFVMKRCAERIDRAQAPYFATGTGTSQPRGFVTAASAGKVGTTGQTTSVIYDDLVDLMTSVDAGYRRSPNCAWMMADSTLAAVLKLKASTGGSPMFDDASDILGFPVVPNNSVATMGANAKSILFGAWDRYTITDVVQETILFRFTDSAYAKLGQVGFLMWTRSSGDLVDSGGAIKYYQNSAT